MNVRLYPNTPDNDNLISDAKDGLESAFSQTIAYFSEHDENISQSIEVDRAYPSINQDDRPFVSQKVAALDRFGSWLVRNSRDQTAVHILLTTGLNGGISGGLLGGAWRNDPAAIASKNGSHIYYKSLCIHEVYHMFINIEDRTRTGSAYSDHILGEVIPTGGPASGKQTPMVNGYLDDGLAAKGKCNRTATTAPYTTTLSECTLEETLYSYRHQGEVL